MVQLGVNRKLLDVSFRSKNKQKKDIVEMIFWVWFVPDKVCSRRLYLSKIKIKTTLKMKRASVNQCLLMMVLQSCVLQEVFKSSISVSWISFLQKRCM